MSSFYRNVKQTQLKVGVFVVICLVALFLSYSWLMDWFMGSKFEKYQVLFDTVNTMERGNTVYFRGVRVGRVTDLSFRHDGILVTIQVEAAVNIDKEATFEIKDKDMMGTKSLEIIPGNHPERLDPREIYRGRGLPGFSDLISNVNSLSEKIESLVDQLDKDDMFVDKLDNLILNADRSLISLQHLMTDINNSDILRSFTELHRASRSINELIADNTDNLLAMLDVTHNTFTKIDSLVTQTGQFVTFFSDMMTTEDGNLNKLLTDDQLYETVINTTRELEILLNDIKKNPRKYFKFSVF
jgi:phospholipid/cholesterol/gamma-HCH transport system substrate-binding protein